MSLFEGKNLRVLELVGDVAAIVLDTAGSKVNPLTNELLVELDQALERIAAADRFALVVLCSGKPASFAHGPDLAWLAAHGNGRALLDYAERGQRLCGKLAELRAPSVAVLGGACLGSGLELALACDYRVALPRPTTLLGFTQIELGLLPCWGGTQRLPRLIGLEPSLRLLASARRLRPTEALALGLIDAVATDSEPPDALAEASKRDWSARPRRNWRQRLLEPNALGRRLILRGARRVLEHRLPDDMPAPWAAVEAVRRAGQHADFAPGLAFEREAIAALADSPAFTNLLWLRQQREQRRVVPAEATRFIRAIGIVGATELGLALAEQLLTKGCRVVLQDADKASLGNAALRLHQTLLQDEVRRGLLSAPVALQCLQNARFTAVWEHFDDLDLVLDTLEDGDRAERFRELEGITTPATILVSTGSADTVAALSAGLQRPQRAAVLHFAGPPGQEPLAELAQTDGAAGPVQQRLQAWVAALGRACLPVRDQPGLLVQRLWLPAFNEAALLLREGMQLTRIDQALDRFGVTPGPLELMDRIGLDTVVRLMDVLQPTFAGRIAFDPTFAEMAQQQMLGTAEGAGFYRYAGRQRRVNARAVALWWAGPGEAWLSRTGLSVAQQLDLVQRRVTGLMVIEAYHCLQERIVPDAATLDFALATAGWAPHRGGPVTYARQFGADAFIGGLVQLASDFGERFTPPAGLHALLATSTAAGG